MAWASVVANRQHRADRGPGSLYCDATSAAVSVHVVPVREMQRRVPLQPDPLPFVPVGQTHGSFADQGARAHTHPSLLSASVGSRSFLSLSLSRCSWDCVANRTETWRASRGRTVPSSRSPSSLSTTGRGTTRTTWQRLLSGTSLRCARHSLSCGWRPIRRRAALRCGNWLFTRTTCASSIYPEHARLEPTVTACIFVASRMWVRYASPRQRQSPGRYRRRRRRRLLRLRPLARRIAGNSSVKTLEVCWKSSPMLRGNRISSRLDSWRTCRRTLRQPNDNDTLLSPFLVVFSSRMRNNRDIRVFFLVVSGRARTRSTHTHTHSVVLVLVLFF